jgi:malate dehydrogenase (oxaloacetate-decarboxylating)
MERLPELVLTLGQQVQRAYKQPTDLAENVYLEQLHDRNEVLYYRLLHDHLIELLPIVYDPSFGEAIKQYSHEYRHPRGVYRPTDRPQDVRRSFRGTGLGADDVLLVVTDAEETSGSAAGGYAPSRSRWANPPSTRRRRGVHPVRCVPVVLDVGTEDEPSRSACRCPGRLGYARHGEERYRDEVLARRPHPRAAG